MQFHLIEQGAIPKEMKTRPMITFRNEITFRLSVKAYCSRVTNYMLVVSKPRALTAIAYAWNPKYSALKTSITPDRARTLLVHLIRNIAQPEFVDFSSV